MTRLAAGIVLLLGLSTVSIPDAEAARDGRIVFSVRLGNNPLGLAAMQPNGDGRRGITDENDFAPEFSPDGRKIAFARAMSDGVYLYVGGPRGQDARPLVRIRPRGRDACGGVFDWGPDSERLAVVVQAEDTSDDCDLYVVDLAGGVRGLLTGPDNVWDPAWSPDGRDIAFQQQMPDEAADIYTIPAEGGETVRLTDDPNSDIDPSWSPDSSKIAFDTDRDDCCGTGSGATNFEIYVMNRDGTEQTRLTHNEINDYEPTWSPYGEWIAYWTSAICDSGCGSHRDIWKIRPDGTDATNLTRSARAHESSPAWSPSGRWIAFVKKWKGSVDLAKVHSSGSRTVRLTRTRRIDEVHPTWR